MDLPTIKGVRLISNHDHASSTALNRKTSVEKLISWGGMNGVLSRDSAEFFVSENGRIKCVANRFIPANKHILHVPYGYDLSFATLKTEIHPDKNWIGWTDLKAHIKTFEEAFIWNPYHYEQKDYFSKNLLLAVCIIGVLNKLKTEEKSSNHSVAHNHTDSGKSSLTMEMFLLYWNALPKDIGNVLFNWTPIELMCLQGSSFGNCLPDARRFGEEIYLNVLLPFLQFYPDLFGATTISLEEYLKINSIILTRSFGTGKKEKSALLPIIDLINGKPNDLHNATLENCAIQKEINGDFIKFHVVETCCDIHAGEEIFLEYAQVGNGDYLMTYNHLPLDPEVIMNNQKTDIFIDFSEYFEGELLRMHPSNPTIRTMKRQHIHGFFNLPKSIPISMEDLFLPQYSCIPSIRQVLIFLQFDENDARKSIKTSRIKSQLSPHQLHHIFHLFLRMIECAMTKPNVTLFRCLLDNRLPASMVSAFQQQIINNPFNLWSQMTNKSSIPMTPEKGNGGGGAGKKGSSEKDKNHQKDKDKEKDKEDPSGLGCTSLASSLTPASSKYFYPFIATIPASEPLFHDPAGLTTLLASSSSAEPAKEITKTQKKKDKQAAKQQGKNSSSTPQQPQTATTTTVHTPQPTAPPSPPLEELMIPPTLTENMKSAIYLQMSERLVMEVMINRFINLFPDRVHELGYSIMREHLVSSEVNSILDELYNPYKTAKQNKCIICGSKMNLSKCSRCRKAYYCSANCQKEHWPYHRNACRPDNSKEKEKETTTGFSISAKESKEGKESNREAKETTGTTAKESSSSSSHGSRSENFFDHMKGFVSSSTTTTNHHQHGNGTTSTSTTSTTSTNTKTKETHKEIHKEIHITKSTSQTIKEAIQATATAAMAANSSVSSSTPTSINMSNLGNMNSNSFNLNGIPHIKIANGKATVGFIQFKDKDKKKSPK
jgi:hypothetical protein